MNLKQMKDKLKKEVKNSVMKELREEMQQEIKNHFLTEKSDAKLWIEDGALKPRRAYHDDAGLDLTLQEDAIIPPGKTVYLKTKLGMDLPPHMLALVVTRSGAPKKDVTIITTLIDSSYKDEISNLVSNFSDEPIHLKKGDRVAQVILLPRYVFENEEQLVETLEKQRPDGFKHGSSDQ